MIGSNYSQNYSAQRSAGTVRYDGVYEGIIKENSDFQRMGRLGVWVPELGTPENDADGWVVAMYVTPFGGATPVDNTNPDQTYMGTQRSYGFWAVPPDPGNRVVVQFLNGEPSRAIWTGCFYQQYRNTMVPNIPVHPNYQYETPVPGAEPNVNQGMPSNSNSSRAYHQEHYEAIRNQGLESDPIRGFSQNGATSSPLPRVYGMLTPKGHYWSLEDTDGDEKIRIRTIGGAQILLDDANSIIYITNQKGNGWVEIDGDGKIMAYSEEGISMRSKKDISFVADRDLLFEAGRNTVLKTADQTFIETTDLYELITNNHDVNVGAKRSEKIQSLDQSVLENKIVDVVGNYTIGVEGVHSTNVEGDIRASTRSNYNTSATGELRVSARGNASFSSQSRTNIISNSNLTLAGNRIIENSGGSAASPTSADPARPNVPDIPPRPTYEYDDVRQLPQDNGTQRRQVRSLASSYPTHEPSWQHSQPTYNRNENATNDENDGNASQTPTEESLNNSILETKESFMQSLLDDIRRHEGVVYRVYPDPLLGASHPTAGIGHLLTPSERTQYNIGDPVSRTQVEEWLAQDIQNAIQGCERIYGSSWNDLNDTRKQVLINMCFNLGEGGLGGFKRMNAAVRRGDFRTAGMEMRDSLWYNQLPTRAEELAIRMERGQ